MVKIIIYKISELKGWVITDPQNEEETMLGEDHSLVNEFPSLKTLIGQLNVSNQDFAQQAAKYHELDTEIRRLELDNAPIDDEAMHKLKHDRAVLKDVLYQQLMAAK